ncbi:MAG: FAD binding domain-containing protein [Deltaproteobacteria bacterium]|nr:FAD binding domain-containing protein [Deltaproteobacteria bacterium]
MLSQDYVFPRTVESALALLKEYGGKAIIIAGGTDLVLLEARKKETSAVLVDISHIPDLCGIREEEGWIVLGANVTHSEAAFSPLIRQKALALAIASGKVGGRQIRNIATVAGNIVAGHPAGDAAVALTALGATCVIRSPDGARRELGMPEMYAGLHVSAVDCHAELLTHIRIPAQGPGEGSSYQRMEQRKALSLPMLCVGARVAMNGKKIKSARIAIAPVGPRPQRATEAEDFLAGKTASPNVFAKAAALADKHAAFRTSAVRGSSEFRHAVLPVFVVRALEEAVARAAGA